MGLLGDIYGGAKKIIGSADPGRGSDTAAAGARKAQGQYQGLAGEQRGYQEQGLNRSLGQYGGLSDAYGQPGAFENFVGSGGAESGLGKYYDRLQSQGIGAINGQMANAGGFGSGARMAAQGNLMSGLEAQRGKDLAGLMGQSQQFQQNRLAGQTGIAGQGANLIQNAYGLGGQMYGQEMGQGIDAGFAGAQYQGQGQNDRSKVLPGIYNALQKNVASGMGMAAGQRPGG